jgi:hypothetical protein
MFVRSILAVAALAGIAVAQRPMPPMAIPPMAPCPSVPPQVAANHCYASGSMHGALPNHETMVRAEVVILRLHPETLKSMELCDDCDSAQKCCLTKCQVRKVMEMAKEDARCEVLSAPQIVTLDGQRAVVCIESAESTGVQFTLTPRVSLDRKFIQVALTAEHKSVEKPCCGSSCASKCDEGTMQRQTVRIHQMQTITTVPTGNSMMMEMYRSEPNRNQPPVLTKTPYISRLFKNGCEECCICVIVTPTELNDGMIRAQPMPVTTADGVNQCQVVVPAPPMMRCPVDCTMPCVPVRGQCELVPPQREENPRLAELMDKYCRACETGDLEKARKLARRCVEIDPTCFMRDR